MARTSKKKRPEAGKQPQKVYSVGIYARLSVDCGDKKNESIETQVEIAKEFVKRWDDMKIYDIYTDIGRTGTNFRREGFERMMRDVRMRKIDCIVVKDLSRFGRNHIETGNYIEKIFPFMGVRFIAVTDNFDSMKLSGHSEPIDVNLKNLVNEMYARDISLKVKASRKTKWEQGSYTGGIPPYGYRAEWIGDKKCLLIEKGTSDIVKKIYELFLAGNSIKEIVVWLYANKVVRPTEYHKTGQVYCGMVGKLTQWPRATVKMILQNPLYMGCLVQRNASERSYMTRDGHDIDFEDWRIKKHTHEAIIREDLFFKAAGKFKKSTASCNKKDFFRAVPWEADPFADILYCGNCGLKMKRITSSKKSGLGDRKRTYSYNCPKAGRIDQFKCVGKSITFCALMKIVKETIGKEAALSGMQRDDFIKFAAKEAEVWKKECNRRIAINDKRLEGITQLESEQYLKYRTGKMSEEEFKRARKENDKKTAFFQKENEIILEKLDIFTHDRAKCDGRGGAELEIVRALVDRIEVYPKHRVKVIFAFKRNEIY